VDWRFLMPEKKMERSRGASFQDLLAGVPGLTLQSETGFEITKYSSRGSGILSGDEPIGVIFLLDGFPFNQGDGEINPEDFSMGSIKYAEVFRGANAFKYGAITLGGAVNLASKTGYDADPFEMRLEGGSFGFGRAEVSSGGVEGPVDYFVSITGRIRDGYRGHSYEIARTCLPTSATSSTTSWKIVFIFPCPGQTGCCREESPRSKCTRTRRKWIRLPLTSN